MPKYSLVHDDQMFPLQYEVSDGKLLSPGTWPMTWQVISLYKVLVPGELISRVQGHIPNSWWAGTLVQGLVSGELVPRVQGLVPDELVPRVNFLVLGKPVPRLQSLVPGELVPECKV